MISTKTCLLNTSRGSVDPEQAIQQIYMNSMNVGLTSFQNNVIKHGRQHRQPGGNQLSGSDQQTKPNEKPCIIPQRYRTIGRDRRGTALYNDLQRVFLKKLSILKVLGRQIPHTRADRRGKALCDDLLGVHLR